jgi:GDP-L-fucose synthase
VAAREYCWACQDRGNGPGASKSIDLGSFQSVWYSSAMQKEQLFSLRGKSVWVAGHNGMVGSAVVERLRSEGCQILTVSSTALDLRDQNGVERWMLDHRPDVVVLAAAKVGGIMANNAQPVDFLYDNLMIEANIIHSAWKQRVAKLLFLGSSCIYPKFAPQPIREDALLSGPLEPTNQWYAIAKIAGIMLCQAYRRQYQCDFISAMPTNLYGPNDNFDLMSGHVLPALLLKAHNAKQKNLPSFEIWGTGSPRREFLHVSDLADALVHLLKSYSGEQHVNIGYGSDLTIFELAHAIKEVVGFEGEIVFDRTKPDGTPRKLMDSSFMRSMGWVPRIDLNQGLRATYAWYLKNAAPLGANGSGIRSDVHASE